MESDGRCKPDGCNEILPTTFKMKTVEILLEEIVETSAFQLDQDRVVSSLLRFCQNCFENYRVELKNKSKYIPKTACSCLPLTLNLTYSTIGGEGRDTFWWWCGGLFLRTMHEQQPLV